MCISGNVVECTLRCPYSLFHKINIIAFLDVDLTIDGNFIHGNME